MKLGSKLAFVLIFSLGALTVWSQGLSATFELAQQLKNNEQHQEALYHYQRVLYFSDGPHKEQSHRQIAECYAQTGNIELSLRHYDQAYYHATADSHANEIMLQKAAANLLNGRYNYALVDLFSVHPSDSIMASRLHFYTGIAFFGKGNFDSARVRFLKVVPERDTVARQKLDSLFLLNDKYHRLNPRAARIMSMIIPGSGQLYSGNVKEAVNSFLITFGFGYLTMNTSLQLSVLDGLLSVFPWFFRYYMGGYNNAEKIANQRIKEREVQIYNGILHVLDRSRSGHSQ